MASSLLVTVFILQLMIHLVNTVGATAINNIKKLWAVITRLPTPISKHVSLQRSLKREYLRLRQDMNSTSSKDEFAKWAKLRRQHDKVLAELEKTSATLNGYKGTFDKTITAARWLGTNGFRFFLQFWYAKEPLFWIPQGWVPRYVEWLLAFPRAPTGSISIQIWGIACVTIIQGLSEMLVGAYDIITKSRGSKVKEPQAFDASGKPLAPGRPNVPSSAGSEESKKGR
ncbi:MAG: hypothetical protein M1825_003371 [Sarcosagium campestre]|nr:MAG: hypothetical protein M1825_003371 [Sarcosagium campestre]